MNFFAVDRLLAHLNPHPIRAHMNSVTDLHIANTSPLPTPHLAMLMLSMGQGMALLSKMQSGDAEALGEVMESAIALLTPK